MTRLLYVLFPEDLFKVLILNVTPLALCSLSKDPQGYWRVRILDFHFFTGGVEQEEERGAHALTAASVPGPSWKSCYRQFLAQSFASARSELISIISYLCLPTLPTRDHAGIRFRSLSVPCHDAGFLPALREPVFPEAG